MKIVYTILKVIIGLIIIFVVFVLIKFGSINGYKEYIHQRAEMSCAATDPMPGHVGNFWKECVDSYYNAYIYRPWIHY